MGFYIEEEEQVWRCDKHPSKRRRRGVCPTCLRNRLTGLCPVCAAARPCSCASSKAAYSSSCSSSSDIGGGETSLRRSRSLSIPFFRSGTSNGFKTLSFLSGLTRSKTKRDEMKEEEDVIFGDGSSDGGDSDSRKRIEDFARMAMRSRSVSAANSTAAKPKLWQLPSPLKAFRNYRTRKLAV